MCEPTTIMIASLAISGAATASSYSRQKKAAGDQRDWQENKYAQDMDYYNQQNEFQMERYVENADRVHAEVRQNYSEIDKRIGQESVVAAMEMEKLFAQSRSLQSGSIALDAERGVTGPTADLLLDDMHRQALGNIENVRREKRWRLESLLASKDEIEAQGNSRIEGMNPQPIPMPNLPQPIQGPDAFASLMNFGAQALSTYSSYLNPPLATTPTPTPPIAAQYALNSGVGVANTAAMGVAGPAGSIYSTLFHPSNAGVWGNPSFVG